MGEMNRDSLRRLATAEHHAAARRAANVRCGSAAPAPPVLRRHAAAFTVLRSPARSLDHVITAAGQPSVRSMAPSSNPHGTALPGLVGGSSARTMLARAPSPTISFRESDPATPAERVRSGLLPARPPRSARPRRPADGRAHRSRRSQGCCVGQGCFVGTTPGPSARSAAVRERPHSREEGWEAFPGKLFAADGAGGKHGDR